MSVKIRKYSDFVVSLEGFPQTLNINNVRTTTSAKSINLYIIRKLVEYFLKNVRVKSMFTLTVFEMLLFDGRTILSPSQRGAGRERVSRFSFQGTGLKIYVNFDK